MKNRNGGKKNKRKKKHTLIKFDRRDLPDEPCSDILALSLYLASPFGHSPWRAQHGIQYDQSFHPVVFSFSLHFVLSFESFNDFHWCDCDKCLKFVFFGVESTDNYFKFLKPMFSHQFNIILCMGSTLR